MFTYPGFQYWNYIIYSNCLTWNDVIWSKMNNRCTGCIRCPGKLGWLYTLQSRMQSSLLIRLRCRFPSSIHRWHSIRFLPHTLGFAYITFMKMGRTEAVTCFWIPIWLIYKINPLFAQYLWKMK